MPVTFPVDLANTTTLSQTLVPQTITTTTNGTGIDMLTAEGPFFVFLSVGDIDVASGNETYNFKVQESTDNSTFTDITGATFTAVTADNSKQVINVTNRSKRYVRGVATLAGTTPSAIVDMLVLHKKKIAGNSGVRDTETAT